MKHNLTNCLIFAAAISAATFVLLPTATIDTSAPQGSPLPASPAESRLRRLWGRESFVPDWEQGDQFDETASDHFLSYYWPILGPLAENTDNAADSGKTGVRIFPAKYWRAVAPDYIPGNDEQFDRVVELFAARGESEPIVVAIRSDRHSRTFSIESSDFVGPSGKLSSTSVTNRLMLPYRARISAGHRPSDTAVRPMVLLKTPSNRWSFPPAYSMSYLVDFHIPKDIPAGTYLGEISVRADGQIIKKIQVALDILPFTLKTNLFHAGAFGTTYDIWEGGFSGYTPEMIEMDSRYGFNLAGGFFNKGGEVPFKTGRGYQLEVDDEHPKFAKFDATMRLLRIYGMGDVAFWNWGASGNVSQFDNVLKYAGFSGIKSADGKRGFAAICRALKHAEAKYEWPEFVINPYDEALKDQNATRHIIQSIPIVAAQSPETRLYMTEWRPGYTRLYQSSGEVLRGKKRPREKEQNALASLHEQPRLNFHVIGANTLDNAARELQDQLGGELWHYGGATQLNAQARLAYGFIPWIIRAEAALTWANYKGDFSGEGWTLHFAMPRDPDGRRNRDTRGPIIPSVRAVAVREGIDDRKYIETLRYYATLHRSNEDLRFLEALRNKTRQLLLNTQQIGGLDNVEAMLKTDATMDVFRARIKDRIIALLRHRKLPEPVGSANANQSP